MFQPIPRILQRLLIGDVKYNYCSFGEVKIIVDNSSVSLLSCWIPKLKIIKLIFKFNFFESIVDTDGRLLRVELSLDVSEQNSTFSNSRSPYDDSFEVFEYLLLISHDILLSKFQFIFLLSYHLGEETLTQKNISSFLFSPRINSEHFPTLCIFKLLIIP